MTDEPDQPANSFDETVAEDRAPGSPEIPASGSLAGGRFAPGTLLEGRYRIVDLVGRGGMGEVYRAEDLKLGEAVALKFLPRALAGDGAALARLHREVRLARRITHKNVVRVHDAGEAEGATFLAMEYIDGENLASLVKRIGRLPEAKALELARQLCAGLAAAHEQGMIHRDLKPANVMIDGEGNAKISDFGLAGLAEELERPELAGTPLYMAPEQLAEGKASYASDLYSLGLVLYEMFSGRRPYRSGSRAELLAEHRSRDPSSLSESVEGIDPLIENAIAACLRREPERRPGSPLDVAAALPGGDPLAAALAAGATPSPEMVARAGGQAALPKPLASALFAVTVLSVLGAGWVAGRISAVSLDRPLEPAVLEHRAVEILRQVGWREVAHTRSSFRFDDYWADRGQRGRAADVEARPTVLEFWLRASNGPITPRSRWRSWVVTHDPPLATSGIATVRLDSRGRLQTLVLPPPALTVGETPWSSRPALGSDRPDAAEPNDASWGSFFELSGLGSGDFDRVRPERAPPYWAERLVAWEGIYPGQSEPRLLIDAATTGGSLVWWQVNEASVVAAEPPGALPEVVLALVVFAAILVLGGWLARRHLATGRGDRRGAVRAALAIAAAMLFGWLTTGAHVASLQQLSLMNGAVAKAALVALAVWLIYMALEPYARRWTPRLLTSWNRLLGGQLADPLVGRDLLIGLAVASLSVLLRRLPFLAEDSTVWFYGHGLRPLYGPLAVLSNSLHWITLILALAIFAVVVTARAVVRSDRWSPLAAFLMLLAVGFASRGFQAPLEALALAITLTLLGAYVGLLGLLAFVIVQSNLVLSPVSLDPSLWWAPNSWIGMAVLLFLAAWAYRAAIRPRAASAG